MLNVETCGTYIYHCAVTGQAVIDSELKERFKWSGPSLTHLL